jgi:Zn-dependent peptidase ImmA (M78 family)/transcriptional regulator with XRE-family HTH domain
MNSFNPERLRSARLLAGLSLRQLEEKLLNKVSYNAINKYERGEMQPEVSTILQFAEVLSMPVSYFFESSTIHLGNIEFRKRNSLTKKEIEQIKIRTRDKIERYLQAERLLGINEVFNNPVTEMVVKDVSMAEQMAVIVRTEWGLGTNPISNVIEMMEENEVKVIEVAASEKFDGLSTFVDCVIPVAVINEYFPTERKRFTALHELGHLMMNLELEDEKEAEYACHRFAGAFLFPETEVRKTLGDKRKNISIGELVAIKEEYGISAQAIMRRALDLNIITDSSYKIFCVKIAGNRKEEGLGMFKGEEKSHRLSQLVFRLYAEGAIDEPKAAVLTGLPASKFRALYNNAPDEEVKTEYAPTTAFSRAWAEDEPDYSDDDIIKINPNYEGW